jgi:glycosyltransferase involved in cell wall biosynthesis
VNGALPSSVSVIMAVYNGTDDLPRTINSVLSQRDCELEFIVINDGSTDNSGSLLDDFARRDNRVCVVHQQNTGLTRALIRGCSLAKGEFIARQDCGDESLPDRLARQLNFLSTNPQYAAVACNTAFVAPRGEEMYATSMTESDIKLTLPSAKAGELVGPPHHGSVMMRTSAYLAAGGYRPEFYVAQDLDLWTRLIELGRFGIINETLYRATFATNAISMTKRMEQVALTKIIEKCAMARAVGESEKVHLLNASKVRSPSGASKASNAAAANYFLGSTLLKQNPCAARHYFSQSLADSYDVKCAVKRALATMLCLSKRVNRNG